MLRSPVAWRLLCFRAGLRYLRSPLGRNNHNSNARIILGSDTVENRSAPEMSATDIVRGFIGALESKDFDSAAEYLAERFTFASDAVRPLGKWEFIGLERALLSAFTAYTHNLTGLRQEQDGVVRANIRITGIHTGTIPVPGRPPVVATGRAIALPEQSAEYVVEDGMIVALRLETVEDGGIDGLLRQLGVARSHVVVA
jgi:hypothetical protein